MARRIVLETWDPAYGTPADPAVLEPSNVTIDPDVEYVAKDWRAISPASGSSKPVDVLFIDGVRRTDAYAWITEGNERPFRGIFASYAAGAVRAGCSARVVAAEVRRVLVAPNQTASVATHAGTWAAVTSPGDSPEDMSSTLQDRLTDLEIEVARAHGGDAELIVIDGPLRGRQDISGAVGYVKTHQVAYLAAELQPIVASLGAGQRTPIFKCTTNWSRYSWYLRLPGPASHAWWGVVRLESSERLEIAKTIALADFTTGVLPRFASQVHKDPRAPQNLFPIGGVEGELRRRLGDRDLIERLLRASGTERETIPEKVGSSNGQPG
jgi:hypothetical protein